MRDEAWNTYRTRQFKNRSMWKPSKERIDDKLFLAMYRLLNTLNVTFSG